MRPLFRDARSLYAHMVAAALVAGCGGGAPAPFDDPSDRIVAAVRCDAWRPSDASGSSLPASRPATLGQVRASPSGRFLYAVGTWFDAGLVRRQILRSDDLGETWCVLPTTEPIAAIVPSRASGQFLYACTYSEDFRKTHLLKTVDGGQTWTTPAAPSPDPLGGCTGDANPLTGDSSLLQTSMTDPNTMSMNFSYSSSLNRPALFLSQDAGESWAEVPPPPDLIDVQTQDLVFPGVSEMLFDPSSPTRVLAWGTVYTLPTGTNTQRWFASRDAGQSWHEVAPPPVPEETRTTRVMDAAPSLYVAGGPVLLHSPDWGETWQSAGPLPPDPTAIVQTLGSRMAGRLYAWRENGGSTDVDETVWTTADGGSTWRRLDVPLYPAIDPVLEAKGPSVLVGKGAFGLSVTTDGSRTWTPRPMVPAPARVARFPIGGEELWADGLPNTAALGTRNWTLPGLRSTDGGLRWIPVDGFYGPLLPDGASARTAFTGVAYGSPGAQRTENGGQTWVPFDVPGGLLLSTASCSATFSCLYVLVAWGNADVCRLARSNDRGRTWTDDAVPSELCYATPALAVARDDPNHLLAACLPWTEVGSLPSLCDSRDGGRTWATHPIGSDPDVFVASVTFMPGGVALAATSTTASIHKDVVTSVVARSTDGGATWTEVWPEGGTLVASTAYPETVFLISFHSVRPSVVARSDDAGATWRQIFPAAELAAPEPGATVTSIADRPGGGFVATTPYGLVKLD